MQESQQSCFESVRKSKRIIKRIQQKEKRKSKSGKNQIKLIERRILRQKLVDYESTQQGKALFEFFNQILNRQFYQFKNQENALRALQQKIKEQIQISQQQVLNPSEINIFDIPLLPLHRLNGYISLIDELNHQTFDKCFLLQLSQQKYKRFLLLVSQKRSKNSIKIIGISIHQALMLKYRGKLLTLPFRKKNKKEKNQKSELQSELCQLQQLYSQQRQKLIQTYQTLYKNIHIQQQFQYDVNKINDSLLEFSVVKCFKSSLSKEPIDYLNFHKIFQFQELEDRSIYVPIENNQELKIYLIKRKPKKGKWEKFALFTSCTACLGTHIDKSNPFVSCKQCHFRTHRICSSVQKHCDRCSYKRLSNQIKADVPECFICGVSGLMIKKIAANRYVHIFCLLAHNLWEIQNQQLLFKTNNKIEQFLLKPQSIQKHQCKCCNKSSPQVFLFRCWYCDAPFHLMCCYLAGYNIQTQQRGNKIYIKAYCCGDQNEKMRISFDRKYKVNYNKITFRKNGIGCFQEE